MKCCKADKKINFSEVRNQFITVACGGCFKYKFEKVEIFLRLIIFLAANLMAMAHGGVQGWTSMAGLTLKSSKRFAIYG